MNEIIYEIFQSKPLSSIEVFSGGVSLKNDLSKYATWKIISDVPNNRMDSGYESSSVRVQFDIYSAKEREVFEIAESLSKELVTSEQGLILLKSGPFFNVGTKRYQLSMDVSFFKSQE